MKWPCCAHHIQNGQFSAVTSGPCIVFDDFELSKYNQEAARFRSFMVTILFARVMDRTSVAGKKQARDE